MIFTRGSLGTLLLVVGLSGCAVQDFREVTAPGTVDEGCPTCGLSLAQGCQCVAVPEYHSTVWFPLGSEEPCDGDIVEEKGIVPADLGRRMDPEPPSTLHQAEQVESPSGGGSENRVAEISDDQRASLVIPEPGWRNSSSPAEGQRDDAATSAAPETDG